MKRATFHVEAREDLEDAVAYFAAQRAGLEVEFLDEFESSLARICDNPLLYALSDDDDDTRHGPLKRFPYSIVYLNLPDQVWVLAVAHQKRRPGFWKPRRQRGG